MRDRIRQIMESTNMTQKTFAEYIGMSQAALSSIFNGRTKPTLNTVEAIRSKMPNISLEWLISGTGDMYVQPQNPGSQDPDSDGKDPLGPELDFDSSEEAEEKEGSNINNEESVRSTLKNNAQIKVKIHDKPYRRITEIRVFYDDRTFESFVPKD